MCSVAKDWIGKLPFLLLRPTFPSTVLTLPPPVPTYPLHHIDVPPLHRWPFPAKAPHAPFTGNYYKQLLQQQLLQTTITNNYYKQQLLQTTNNYCKQLLQTTNNYYSQPLQTTITHNSFQTSIPSRAMTTPQRLARNEASSHISSPVGSSLLEAKQRQADRAKRLSPGWRSNSSAFVSGTLRTLTFCNE